MLSAVPCPRQASCQLLFGWGVLEHWSDTETSPVRVLITLQVVFAFFLGVDVFLSQGLCDLYARAATLQRLRVIREEDVFTIHQASAAWI